MKLTATLFAAAIAAMLFTGCKKDDPSIPSTPGGTRYSSLEDFYSSNGPAMQYYTLDAATGGSFTSPQGTVVTIRPNSLKDQQGNTVTGQVSIEFKDLYKKSDMLLAQMPAQMYYGAPLKSGGEFFIRAMQGNSALQLDAALPVEVQQPLNGVDLDTAMLPFVGGLDSVNGPAWFPTNTGSVFYDTQNYIFSLYSFSLPAAQGTWCNSDNASYFGNYSQTTLTINSNSDMSLFQPDVYLVFQGVNSMVHVYSNGAGGFPYSYAPQGLSCTVVAIGVKDEKLYASFTPVTIGSNQAVSFTLAETTADDFKVQLSALND